jgi:hypothetical protein
MNYGLLKGEECGRCLCYPAGAWLESKAGTTGQGETMEAARCRDAPRTGGGIRGWEKGKRWRRRGGEAAPGSTSRARGRGRRRP